MIRWNIEFPLFLLRTYSITLMQGSNQALDIVISSGNDDLVTCLYFREISLKSIDL
jgi:hypothetical protein